MVVSVNINDINAILAVIWHIFGAALVFFKFNKLKLLLSLYTGH